MNRLNLDFHLSTSDERNEFINAYLNKNLNDDHPLKIKYNEEKKPFPFPYNPTTNELETIANYVLYGKANSDDNWDLRDKKGIDGKRSVVDAGYVEIKSKNSAWNRKEEDSLDAMFEAAGETGKPLEVQYGLIGDSKGVSKSAVRYKIPKANFSREEARERLGEGGADEDLFLLGCFEDLWHQIDLVEYIVTVFDLKIGRRKAPVREELEDRLSIDDRIKAKAKAGKLNIYTWSKMRKLLVELRREQYVMMDSYAPTIGKVSQGRYDGAVHRGMELMFNEVLPCGLKHEGLDEIFMSEITEDNFSARLIGDIKDIIERLEGVSESQGVFDFRNIDHITLLIYARDNILEYDDEEENIENREYAVELINTLDYYIGRAKLEDFHRDIIKMKARGNTNDDIRAYLNEKYNKTYAANYISTIFRSKCCKEIALAAVEHLVILREVLKGREGFKICNTCHKLLLKDNNNFVKKARAKDGLAGRCKSCDKKARAGGK